MLAPFSYSMSSKKDLGVEQNKYWKLYSTIIMIYIYPLALLWPLRPVSKLAFFF